MHRTANGTKFFHMLFLAAAFTLTASGITSQSACAAKETRRDLKETSFSEACHCIKTNNFKGAHAKLQALADNNHAKAMTLLGMLYERGLGVEKDVNKAARYYTKAAQKGLPEAESRLGHLLLNSESKLTKQTKSAGYWLEKAASHGVSEAQATLGKLYYEGNHLPINNSEAVRWLRQAADQGHVEAQNMLAQIPVLKDANARFQEAGNQYQANMNNLERSWQGYADIVNSVNAAASYQPNK